MVDLHISNFCSLDFVSVCRKVDLKIVIMLLKYFLLIE